MALNIEKFDPSRFYPRHKNAYSTGGVHLKEEEGSTVNTRDIVVNLIKTVGSKLKEGKILDLLKVSRPAIISFPRTYLECVAGDVLYTQLLDKAATCENPVERLKHIVAFVMAGLHRNAVEMGNNGPLNPILGETFYAEKADGTKLYCEQISHHPPVSAYLLIHPQNAYKLYGTGEVAARLTGLNTIHGQRVGETTVEFKNGDKVVIANPEMKIDGIVMGDRTLNHIKSFTITDKTNNITAEITFNYEEVGTISKITSGFMNLFKTTPNVPKPYSDTFTVVITGDTHKELNESGKTVLSRGSGSWLCLIELDGEVYWRVNDDVESEKWTQNEAYKLASDSTNRLDSKYIKEKNYELAQKEKDALENLQRHDAKLRKEYIAPEETLLAEAGIEGENAQQ